MTGRVTLCKCPTRRLTTSPPGRKDRLFHFGQFVGCELRHQVNRILASCRLAEQPFIFLFRSTIGAIGDRNQAFPIEDGDIATVGADHPLPL
jgi:hypothetical protein